VKLPPILPGAFTDFVKRQIGSFPLTVMFNSPGGDLIAGLALGREIRRPATSIAVKLAQNPGPLWDVKLDRVGSFVTPLPSAFRTFAQTMERSCHCGGRVSEPRP
jgi:hypothetical protein